ncbi:MAG: carboxylating nicotinate-nucleotide diphosphorylase [Thiotrichaceae bacterium]|nr:carboxylating nicotinate-nucleotide diphosphorylase [Thiotrichaceae bacterium]
MNLPDDLLSTVQQALREDIRTGDINALLIPESRQATAQVISRESAILAGSAWFNSVFQQIDPSVKIQWEVQEGQEVSPNQCLCTLSGAARTLLTGERTALNFLQVLSGTATQARRYVQAVQHTHAKILDTRKTLPGLRSAQKYAVLCAGGVNHRMGLYDAFLLKENHIAAAGSISAAVAAAQKLRPELPIEVEVETLAQIPEAIAAGATRLLLDNFTLEMLREAVALVQGKVSLEASGGVNLETVVAIAETGVDFISVGAMTKDVRALDLSMRIVEIV